MSYRMSEIVYVRHGIKYLKLERSEIIKEGAMQSLHCGQLYPITNNDGKTIGNIPDHFFIHRDFYNPI